MEKRRRNVQIKFRVTPEEYEQIEAKMARCETVNKSAYLRKMALDGYIVNLDLPELREISVLLRRISNNINQIARRANETHRVYDEDLRDIQQQQNWLIRAMGEVLTALSALQ